MTNDSLLDQLHQFVAEVLDFRPIVAVSPNLRGGLADTPALAVAVHSDKGAPMIVLDAGYTRWPADELIHTYCHEVAHHRLHHVHEAARLGLKAPPGSITQAGELQYERNERTAEQVAKSYVKGFEKWREKAQIEQLQKDVEFIKWALRQRGLVK